MSFSGTPNPGAVEGLQASLNEREDLYRVCNLRQRNIRLLKLDPSCAEDNEPLKGTLRTVSLDANPVYDALSYTWGSDKDNPSCNMLCSEINIPITKNCYDALRSLAKNLKVQSIWIDAICINQKDNNEKSHQIPLMRDIYGKATRVLIWLGIEYNESDKAIDWVKYAARNHGPYSSVKMRSFPGMMWPPEVWKIVKLVPEHIEKIRLRFATEPAYNPRAMTDLIGREWFTRMWTIQELVMANDPFIVCGDKSTRWNNLNWAIIDACWNHKDKNDANTMEKFKSVSTGESFWLDLYAKSELSEARVRKWMQRDRIHGQLFHALLDLLERDSIRWLGSALKAILAIVTGQWIFTNERPFISIDPPKRLWFLALLLSSVVTSFITPAIGQGARGGWDKALRETLPGILNLLRGRDATDHRDKVFALHGVFEELDLKLPAADWTKPLEQVYLEFTCAFLRWHKSLELLREVSQDKLPNVPSWVPDLSKPHQRIGRRNYNAARGSQPVFSIIYPAKHPEHKGIPRIISQAVIIAKITYCTPPIPKNEDPPTPSSPPFSNAIRTLLTWLSLSAESRFYSSPWNTEADKAEAVFRLFHAQADFAVQDETQYREDLQRWLAAMKNYVPSQALISPATVEAVEECAQTLLKDESLLSTTIRLCSAPQKLSVATWSSNTTSKTASSSSISNAGKEAVRTRKEAGNKERLGAVPPHTRVGDVIALLSGMSVPFALRRVESSSFDRGRDREEDVERKGKEEGWELMYEVVGACYLEGAMLGEEWPDGDEEVGVEKICLV